MEVLKACNDAPTGFIDDLFDTSTGSYVDGYMIRFDKVIKWLDVDTDGLRQLLINNFEKDIDYTVNAATADDNLNGNHISVTADCFKCLCTFSGTQTAITTRKRFISIERQLKQYYAYKAELCQEIFQLNKSDV